MAELPTNAFLCATIRGKYNDLEMRTAGHFPRPNTGYDLATRPEVLGTQCHCCKNLYNGTPGRRETYTDARGGPAQN
jgi:hypothetical protein